METEGVAGVTEGRVVPNDSPADGLRITSDREGAEKLLDGVLTDGAGDGRVEESPVSGAGRFTLGDETGAVRDADGAVTDGREVLSEPAAEGTGIGRDALPPVNDEEAAGDGARVIS